MSDDEVVEVPRRWVDEVCSALDAASVIGMRSCRDGDHLNYSNHDRLIREADDHQWPLDEAMRGMGYEIRRRSLED